MGASDEAQRQLRELERVVEYLERMNLRDVTAVPSDVTAILVAAGLTDMSDLRPSALLPRVLDRQQILRRRLAAMRRARST
jgi:hypothetical protein